MEESISTYQDALYNVKRNFLIIGLTGYTGSGCSEARSILASQIKPVLPNFDAISECISQNDTEPSTVMAKPGDNDRDRRIYDKLSRTWNSLRWDTFIPIKISAIIFCLCAA